MLSVETVLNMLFMQEGDKHSSELYMSTSSLAAPEAYSAQSSMANALQAPKNTHVACAEAAACALGASCRRMAAALMRA